MSSSRSKRAKTRVKRRSKDRQAVQGSIASLLAHAQQLHRRGQLEKARIVYQRILTLHAHHADALHFSGVIAYQTGDSRKAVDFIYQAIAQNPAVASFHNHLGLALSSLGQLEAAKKSHQTAISLDPRSIAAHNNLGIVLYKLQDFDSAAVAYQTALQLQPDFSDAATNLGTVLLKLGRLEEAEAACQHAARLQPTSPEVHHNLGLVLRQQGQYAAAADAFQTALELRPDYAEAHLNLGTIWQAQGDYEAALQAYQTVLGLRPELAEAHNNLGTIQQAQGQFETAMASYQTAIRLKPDNAEAYNNLAALHQSLGDLEMAKQTYETALSFNLSHAEIYHNLGHVLRLLGDFESAVAVYQEALRLQPDDVDALNSLGTVAIEQGRLADALSYYQRSMHTAPMDGLRIRLATLLPPIYASHESMIVHRQQLIATLNQLDATSLTIADPMREGGATMFYLAYQGLNDRDIQQSFARLYARAYADARTIPPVRQPCHAKPTIGFISTHFYNHTVGKLTRGLIEHLSRDLFDVVVFAVGARKDTLASQIRDSVERYVVLPHHLPVMRETILEQHVDVLFYPDIGMHPITYFLALSRLAPVQCVSWGHPVTTGLDMIDYFLSSADLEPDAAEEHYTEHLVRLSALPTYYYRPPLPESPRDRAAFGLSEQEHLYLCPQSLFKFHPDFDAILVELLRRDPQGRLILLEGGRPHWTSLLLERWRTTLADVIDRVSFLPRIGEHDFLSLIMLSEVLLDPVHFGGGNTTYEAFAMGTPIVTQPGCFMRGRVTYACYKKMGFNDCIASTPEAYVDIAARLGTDRDYRKAVSEVILSRNHILYKDMTAVKELEQFFLRVL